MGFASQLFVSDQQEKDFRREIEAMLRADSAEAALGAIDAKLTEIEDCAVATLALSVSPDGVAITGWERLAPTMEALDRHGQPISAIALAFCEPDAEAMQVDAEMKLAPVVQATFYCDEAFPFGGSDRDALNEAWKKDPPRWRGLFEHVEKTLGVSGLDALYGAWHAMRPHVMNGSDSEPADLDAARLAAMRMGVLLHMAIARAVREHGLPRPMAILSGGDSAYPDWEAAVATRAEVEETADADGEDDGVDEGRFTSLTTLAPVRPNANYRFTVETEHLSGRSLRHRLIRDAQAGVASDVAPVTSAEDESVIEPDETPESEDVLELGAMEETRKSSLIGRLLRRSA